MGLIIAGASLQAHRLRSVGLACNSWAFGMMICMFVDRVTLFVKGGDGGRGCCSFRREKYVPRGGPDGGDGGDGGSVIVQAVAGTDSLAEVVHRKHWRAPAGG